MLQVNTFFDQLSVHVFISTAATVPNYDEGGSFSASGQEAPTVFIRRQGWEAAARTAEDTMGDLSRENLSEAGRALAMTLMILGREINY